MDEKSLLMIAKACTAAANIALSLDFSITYISAEVVP